ncbi:hypothetical protein SAMCCGM7_pC0308 (plasmid) [Sinorhizobium americanum CCGM7]|nr:hypothetical protein SAMCCGM7_pC0308 [Sinorhizobium americanum CCGM7]
MRPSDGSKSPAEGQSSDDLEFPAPGIKLLEKQSEHDPA